MGANDGGNFAGERLAIDPHLTSTLYMGSRYDGLWRSVNSGANWSKVSSFPVTGDSGNGVAWVIFGAAGSNGSATQTIYAGVWAVGSGSSNIYRSTDAGATWAVVPGGPSGMITPRASLGSDGMLWMTFDDSISCKTGQIWKLNTATLAWSNVTPSNGPPSGQAGYSGISVDAQNPQHAAITTYYWYGGTDKCFQTVDGGITWTVVANVQNSWDAGPFPNYNINGAAWTHFCSPYSGGAWLMQCIRIDPFNSNNAIYTTGGGLWSTANLLASPQPAGITWTFTDYGIEQTAVLFLCPSYKPGVFFSALGDISGMRYTNLDQAAPTNYCNPQVGNTNCIDYAENNANVVARVGNSSATNSDVAFSADNGQSWAPAASAPPGYTTNTQMRSVAVAADGSRTLVCPNSGYGNPAYSTNSGAAWITCNGLPSGSDLSADRVNASVFYATNGSSLYRSSDGGANFSVVNSTGGGIPRAVFGITDEIWVANGSGLFRYTNAGATQFQVANVSSANSVGFGKAAPGQSHPALYLSGTVSGTFGYFRCDDGAGSTWVRINDNLHQFGSAGWCGGDQGAYGRMYIGTNGRGTLYCDSVPAGTPTMTPTFTPYQGTPTSTQTPSPTPSPSSTQTPVCSSLIDGFEALNDNGAWSGGYAVQSIVSAGTAPAGAVTQGLNCMMVNVTVGASYNSNIMRLSGFIPGTLAAFTQLKIDVYMPAGMVDAGYNQMQMVADCSACPNGAGTGIWYQSISDAPNFTTGAQTLTFNINFAAGGLPLTATVSSLDFILNQGSAHTGPFYADNLRLVGACGVASPTPSPTASATPSRTQTRTASPSSTPSGTATVSISPSPTTTATPTPSLTATASPTMTVTPSATVPATFTMTATATPSPSTSSSASASASVTPTPTDVPVGSTATSTPTPSPALSATPWATASASDTLTASSTPTASSTATVSATASNTEAATPTAIPTLTPVALSCTDSPTIQVPTGTPSMTLTISPSVTPTATPSHMTPLPTATGTPTAPAPTLTASPSVTGSPVQTLTQTPMPGAPVLTSMNPNQMSSSSSGTQSLTLSGQFLNSDVVIVQGGGLSVTLTPQTFNASQMVVQVGPLAAGSYSVSVRDMVSGLQSGILTLPVKQPGLGSGPFIPETHPVPNPNPVAVKVLLNYPADAVELKIYTEAMVMMGSSKVGSQPAGWAVVPLPWTGQRSVPPGTYFYTVSAQRYGSETRAQKVGRLVITR